MQGVWGDEHLSAPANKEPMQGVWGGQATRARRRGGGGRCSGKETATCQASSDPAAAFIDRHMCSQAHPLSLDIVANVSVRQEEKDSRDLL